MRSYGQYCALAKALDVVGDRWTLLIVRELLIRGGCRYTDLKNGLPGIATNLLATRLTELEESGIIRREEAPPPVATTLFRLTARGEALENVLLEIGRWGAPLLGERDADDAFSGHWLALPLKLYVADRTPKKPKMTIELRTGDETVALETTGDGSVRTRLGSAEDADAVITGDAHLILQLLMRKVSLPKARAAGLRLDGDAKVLDRLAAK